MQTSIKLKKTNLVNLDIAEETMIFQLTLQTKIEY